MLHVHNNDGSLVPFPVPSLARSIARDPGASALGCIQYAPSMVATINKVHMMLELSISDFFSLFRCFWVVVILSEHLGASGLANYTQFQWSVAIIRRDMSLCCVYGKIDTVTHSRPQVRTLLGVLPHKSPVVPVVDLCILLHLDLLLLIQLYLTGNPCADKLLWP